MSASSLPVDIEIEPHSDPKLVRWARCNLIGLPTLDDMEARLKEQFPRWLIARREDRVEVHRNKRSPRILLVVQCP